MVGGRCPAALLDTPYGFQENAAELSTRLTSFFADRVGNPVAVASFAGSGDETADHRVAMARVRDASFVFSGPGSPTYALRHWADSELPALLADKLATGGVLVMASAAALTLGRLTAPIYEIYKVGEDPRWLPGLDLLSAVGLPVAVIPHYDNAEGGTHDTRFCFMGARRFESLEAQMPDDTFILGIDENTALILDVAAGRAKVLGKGGVTVRRRGRGTVFGTGTDLAIAEMRTAAFDGEQPRRRASRPAVHRPDGGEPNCRAGRRMVRRGERTNLFGGARARGSAGRDAGDPRSRGSAVGARPVGSGGARDDARLAVVDAGPPLRRGRRRIGKRGPGGRTDFDPRRGPTGGSHCRRLGRRRHHSRASP